MTDASPEPAKSSESPRSRPRHALAAPGEISRRQIKRHARALRLTDGAERFRYRQVRRMHVGRRWRYARNARLISDDAQAAGMDNAGFFACNRREALAEESLVV